MRSWLQGNKFYFERPWKEKVLLGIILQDISFQSPLKHTCCVLFIRINMHYYNDAKNIENY